MTRWTRGETEVEELIVSRQLQKVTGAAANGGPLLDKAGRTLATAESIAADDPDSAFVLAYDGARYAGTALLAHQGLRPTTSGGHYAVELALRAQFGDGFRGFGALRRRRNELEYPSHPVSQQAGPKRPKPSKKPDPSSAPHSNYWNASACSDPLGLPSQTPDSCRGVAREPRWR